MTDKEILLIAYGALNGLNAPDHILELIRDHLEDGVTSVSIPFTATLIKVDQEKLEEHGIHL